MAKDGKQKAFERLARLAKKLKLEDVTHSTSYGDPALKVRDKGFATVKDAITMVLPCPFEAKELLMQSAPEIYWQTDHYKGWPGLLVRLDVIDDEELALRLADAWAFKAPPKLAAARVRQQTPAPPRSRRVGVATESRS